MARKGLNIYRRKDGRWEGRYIKGRTPDGKSVYGYVYGSKFSEVKEQLMPLKAEYSCHFATERSDFNGDFADWLAYWLHNVIRPTVKPATYASYFNKAKTHILPELGSKKADKLTERDIQDFVNSLSQSGLAPNSVRAIFRVLNAALAKAATAHIIFANPCKDIKLPQAEKTNVSALSLPQQKSLETVARQNKDGAAVMLALYTGMRIGEICALQWSDIDFDKQLIKIQRTVERIADPKNEKQKTEIVFGLPKTSGSCRTIPIPTHLVEYLGEVKANAHSDYVISCKGSFAEPRITRYRFHKMLEQADLPMLRFHALRHTFATRCIERNVDVTTLSRLLGHKSPKLTLDTYTDSMLEQQKLAMCTLDVLFASDKSEQKMPASSQYKILQTLALLLEGERTGA